jgi:hypothetical protein
MMLVVDKYDGIGGGIGVIAPLARGGSDTRMNPLPPPPPPPASQTHPTPPLNTTSAAHPGEINTLTAGATICNHDAPRLG